MSPASKLKSKDKLAARTVKEQKTLLKSTHAPTNSGSGIPESAYSPVLGTFHALETEQSASLPSPQNNGRFRNTYETDDHSGSSLGTSAEYDSLSNNDSCSGDSEDHKEKTKVVTIPQTESIPGCDTDKRDKVRQKNEKKHQRQKERRAQELHERCNSFLMSRKLEALAQKFVAMGISSERATMALILNEGRVEESVAWLFEGNEDGKQQSVTNLDGADLKIDIAEELAQIAALEAKYNCTKHEVERAVVACDGDLGKAEDALKVQKQEPTVVAPVLEHSGGPVAAANHLSNNLSPVQNPAGRISVKGTVPMSIQQQGQVAAVPYIELANRNMQASRNIPTKQERATPQVAAFLDRRQPTINSSPSASYSLAPPLQAAIPQANPEVRYVAGGVHEVKTNMQATSMLKEPIIVLQRPQSNTLKQRFPSTSIGLSVSPPGSTGWYPNNTPSTEVMKMAAAYDGLGHKLRNPRMVGSAAQQLYPQNQYQPFVSGPTEPGIPQWSGTWSTTGTSSIRTSSSIALPSSLGLFTGWGSSASSGSSSPVNWSTGGLISQCDYNSIDWTLDSTLLRPALNSSDQFYESDASSRTFMSTKELSPVNNSGVYLGGLQEGKLTSAPSTQWTSAFNGRDLFGAPRQFVTYPSL